MPIMLPSQGHQDYCVDMVEIVGVALFEAQDRLVHAPCWQRRTWGGLPPADQTQQRGSSSCFVAQAVVASNSAIGAACQPLYCLS